MQDDTQREQVTPAWIAQTWASFALSLGTTLVGVYHLPVDNWIRAFLAMGIFFIVGSCMTLAKTIRDVHESRRLINRIRNAKAEKIIRDFEEVEAA
ncbi:MAG: hypothetical protein B7733_17950 [Myxococcales bacterium FL481]|nr:MAG: hypothetical protein B7733_17950 [Myxococcales bacterium FL481]